MSCYHVYAVFDGAPVCGIHFDPRLLSVSPQEGMAIVADLLLPISYEVEQSSVRPITRGDANRLIAAAREEAIAHSASLGEGLSIGKCFSFTHEDGQTWYLVTELTKDQAYVEWRGFSETRHKDCRIGWGGWLDRKVVQGYVARQDAIQSLGGLALDAING